MGRRRRLNHVPLLNLGSARVLFQRSPFPSSCYSSCDVETGCAAPVSAPCTLPLRARSKAETWHATLSTKTSCLVSVAGPDETRRSHQRGCHIRPLSVTESPHSWLELCSTQLLYLLPSVLEEHQQPSPGEGRG
jgi:hypothetical protein